MPQLQYINTEFGVRPLFTDSGQAAFDPDCCCIDCNTQIKGGHAGCVVHPNTIATNEQFDAWASQYSFKVTIPEGMFADEFCSVPTPPTNCADFNGAVHVLSYVGGTPPFPGIEWTFANEPGDRVCGQDYGWRAWIRCVLPQPPKRCELVFRFQISNPIVGGIVNTYQWRLEVPTRITLDPVDFPTPGPGPPPIIPFDFLNEEPQAICLAASTPDLPVEVLVA